MQECTSTHFMSNDMSHVVSGKLLDSCKRMHITQAKYFSSIKIVLPVDTQKEIQGSPPPQGTLDHTLVMYSQKFFGHSLTINAQ